MAQDRSTLTPNCFQSDTGSPSANDRLALGIHEVCRLTGLGRTSICHAISVGDLVARKFGRRTVVLAADLDAFLNRLPAAREQPRRINKE